MSENKGTWAEEEEILGEKMNLFGEKGIFAGKKNNFEANWEIFLKKGEIGGK